MRAATKHAHDARQPAIAIVSTQLSFQNPLPVNELPLSPPSVPPLTRRHRARTPWFLLPGNRAFFSSMDLAAFQAHCLALPEAEETFPFGPDVVVYKVRGKIFALALLDDVPPRLNLKCDPDRALELRDRYPGITPGYHMNKRHWNTVRLDGSVPSRLVQG